MSRVDHEIGLLNDQLRKHGEGLVRLMIPTDRPRHSPILDLMDQAIVAIKRFEFPEQETGLRDRGEVNVEGYVFEWEISWMRDDLTVLPVEQRVLTVYWPHT